MKNYLTFFAITLILVGGVIKWILDARIDEHRAYHEHIATQSVSNVSKEISAFVEERKRLVQVFASTYRDLLIEYIKQPNDAVTQDRLTTLIRAWFPDFFTFTVADATGTPYTDDFDGLVGDLCKNDLKRFSETNTQFPRLHPNSAVYHFDIFAPFDNGKAKNFLFLSFHADNLGRVLKTAQITDHQLMLIDEKASHLIEITADGARINWPRDDYRLSASEKMRILARESVPQTVWTAADLHAPELFTTFSKKLKEQALVVMGLIVLVGLLTLIFVHRIERLRKIAERHKDEFLSVVSHELRTPITAVRGALGLVATGHAGPLEPKGQELIDLSLRNCERLSILVNDILDLQKIEAGKMEFYWKEIELAPLLENAVQANQGYANKFGVSFVSEPFPAEIFVKVDETRITQVMANLLSNAAKYGAENDVITVSAEVYDKRVRINVADHGPGIPESFRKRIFQKFAQADSSDTRHKGGSGLGLSIVQRIIEAHGGKVGYQTTLGTGTTFYFALPIITNASTQDA